MILDARGALTLGFAVRNNGQRRPLTPAAQDILAKPLAQVGKKQVGTW